MGGLARLCQIYGSIKIIQDGKEVTYVWDGEKPVIQQPKKRANKLSKIPPKLENGDTPDYPKKSQ